MTLLDDIAAARAELDNLDAQLRQLRAELSAARSDLDAASTAGDGTAEQAAADQVAAVQDRITATERRRDRTLAAMTKHRAGLLAQAQDPLTLADVDYPLLLLPVRLETRFAWQHPRDPARHTMLRPAVASAVPVLLVRIYPDDVHVDSHDPALTTQEARWLRAYLKRAAVGMDREHFVAAWEELVARAGATRAAWIVRSRPPNKPRVVADRWGRPARAALLPDQFVARALVDGQWLQQTGLPVREPLDLSPDPAAGTGAGSGVDGLRWMVDFAEAQQAGLGLVIELPASTGGPPAVDQLVVVGVHVSRDPKASTEAFQALLDAHHYTRGLAFVRPGAATNATPGERTDRTTSPDIEQVFAVEGDLVPLVPPATLVDDPRSDGVHAAGLLGIDAAVFGHVAGADGRWRQAGQDIRQLIAGAWLGPMRHLLDPLVARDDLTAAADYYVGVVDGLGPLPVLRVGDQPYGVLPVSIIGPEQGDLSDFENRLAGVLSALRREIWEPAVARVPRIGGPPADPTDTLLALLRSDGVPQSLAIRPAIGPYLAAAFVATLDRRRLKALGTMRQLIADLLGRLAATPGSPPIAELVLTEPVPLPGPLVQPAEPGPGESARDYLDLLSLRPPLPLTLLELAYETATLPIPRPKAFLYALARLALLDTADRCSRALLLAEGIVDDATAAAWDSDRDDGSTPLYALTDRLNTTLPADPYLPIHGMLTGSAPPAASVPFLYVREAIRSLAFTPPELVETVLRAELGTVTHRLDAWYTALTTERLRRLRSQPNREFGLVVGGYGVLLDIRPNAPATAVDPSELPAGQRGEVLHTASNGGYVHTPSVNHAVTAGVLRSAHLAQWRLASGAGQDAFRVDLSSRRVRTALRILDGIREGQPLGALLGYRVERRMRADAPAGIAVLRRAAPLVAGRLTTGGPAEQVAANNVVDAVALIELTGAGDSATVEAALTPHRGGVTNADWPDVVKAAVAAIADAADALDSVADVLVAEGVYQLVQGNPTRSAGSVDAIAAAGTPPPEPSVVSSVRGGVAVLHRVVVALPSAGTVPADDPDGWARTPRVLLEPTLERWARAVLPAPADVALNGTTLAALQRAAYDAGATALRLSALDVVAATPAAVEARLAGLAGAPVVAGDGLAELLEAAAALRELLSGSRPLRAADLAQPGGDAAATAQAVDAHSRLDTFVTAVRTAHAALQAAVTAATTRQPPVAADRTALLAALLAADAVGATQPVPARPLAEPADQLSDDLVELVPAAVTARDELAGRLAAHDALAVSGDEQRAAERAGALACWALPALSTTPAPVPAGATPAAMRRHLMRTAAVRPALARLDRVLGTVEALTGGVPELSATQRPLAPGEEWVALGGGPVLGGRLSVLAHAPFQATAADPVAGLLVDEWTEVVPDATATTSMAFHYDAPSSAAPNVALLGVPRPNMEQWSTDEVVALVFEALDLAKLRAVDPDAMAGAGQLLPALFSRENPEPGIGASLDVAVLTDPS